MISKTHKIYKQLQPTASNNSGPEERQESDFQSYYIVDFWTKWGLWVTILCAVEIHV